MLATGRAGGVLRAISGAQALMSGGPHREGSAGSPSRTAEAPPPNPSSVQQPPPAEPQRPGTESPTASNETTEVPSTARTSPEGFLIPEGAVEAPVGEPASTEPDTVRELRAQVVRRPTADGFRRLADACAAAECYSQAVEAYRAEAALRRKDGDPNAALVEEATADRWETRLMLYREAPTLGGRGSLARWEPEAGCYIGAIVERDDHVQRNAATFNRMAGKDHAVFFDYRAYGMPFPDEWAARLRSIGAAAQIAWEPNRGLDEVRDDSYLRAFAEHAGAAGLPVFLRFASEMNGDWTHYGGNPTEYVRKWRLVADTMRRYAPNVAMVWCPNVMPQETIPSYYPGDAYVDWVGVNFYAVHHHDNMLDHPADHEDPSDALRFIYRRYAERKPVMVGEFAATHFCATDGVSIPGFAVEKLEQLYSALPRLYPRVKAIHWYDIDNMNHAERADRRCNNFGLTDNPQVFSAYQRATADPYFVSRVVGPEGGKAAESRMVPVASRDTLSGTVRLSCWAKSYATPVTVVYRLDGKAQVALSHAPYAVVWNTEAVSDGHHDLEIVVTAGKRIAASRAYRVTVRSGAAANAGRGESASKG